VKPTLTVVGKSEPDDTEIKRAEEPGRRMVETVKDGGMYFLLMVGEQDEAAYFGDLLEIASLTEEVARQAKLEALGLS
jgi:hypothetical protein